MHLHSISNSRLHCCLVGLILFILIFLSLPLLLIYLANSGFEKSPLPGNHHSNRINVSPIELTGTLNQSIEPSTGGASVATALSGNGAFTYSSSSPLSTDVFQLDHMITTTTIPPPSLSVNTISPSNIYELTQNSILFNQQQSTNCTQFAAQANLSLADENVHCPIGYFPCQLCPNICIEQWRNCDGQADCPDRSDESSCHDGNGAIGVMFKKIFSIATNKKQSSSSASSLAKPDSCTLEQFEQEQCPCVYADPRVIICEGLGLTSVPNTLLSSVYKIRMSNNSIANIDNVLWPRSLSALVLTHNRIERIGRSTFELAPNLSKLYLSHNEISYIDNQAFAGLSELTYFTIESNKLTTFDSRMLIHTPQIAKIYLSENMIDLPEETQFGHCQYLRELLLDHNRISTIRAHWFSNMTSLIWLSLTHNEISYIEDGSFHWNYELEELNLSFNKIIVINRQMFASNLNIERLYLGGNPLETLPTDAFREIVQLKSLNLTNVHFTNIQRETFSYLRQLEFIYFSKFRYCHYASHVRVCLPRTDGLSSAEDLLAFPILKYAVWIVASACSLGNMFVFIWRTMSPNEDPFLSLFVRNLSIADLMMGIYLGVIGWQDYKFEHNFGHHAIEWMSSWTCAGIGFLATLSTELSVFILTIITIERYRSITSMIRIEEDTQKRRARVYMLLAWPMALLIAIYPLVGLLMRNSDYYATNGLCLPLHIDQPFSPGWLYSAFVYLGINFTAVMIIILLYSHMYTMIMDGRQATRPAILFKAEKREDAILAVRFFFIVVTDCLCWIPIVVIKVVALTNVSISSSIYGWLVVFIIPINSALNPIVYTLMTTSMRATVWRLFERVCFKLDLLTATAATVRGTRRGGSNGGGSSASSGSTATTVSSSAESKYSSKSSSLESGCQERSPSYYSIMAANRRRRDTGSTSTTCVVESTGVFGANSGGFSSVEISTSNGCPKVDVVAVATRAVPCASGGGVANGKNLLAQQVKFNWPYDVNDV